LKHNDNKKNGPGGPAAQADVLTHPFPKIEITISQRLPPRALGSSAQTLRIFLVSQVSRHDEKREQGRGLSPAPFSRVALMTKRPLPEPLSRLR